MEMLQGRVSATDVEIIKGIPICLFPQPDRLIWHFTSNGLYSVKLAYYVALSRKRARLCIGEQSNDQENRKLWKLVWKLDIPPKVKHFVWRACNNWLPVRLNLLKRGIGFENTCPVCSEAVEDVYHALVGCQAAKVSWFACVLGLHSDRVNTNDFTSWFIELAKKLHVEQVEIVAMVAWEIWNVRNSQVHEEFRIKPEMGLAQSMGLLGEFKSAKQNVPSVAYVPPINNMTRWSRPPLGALKLNCDASVKNNGFVGISFVVRNCMGDVVDAGVDPIYGELGCFVC